MYKNLMQAGLAALLTLGAAQAGAATAELMAGDPEAGKALTTTCMACHGQDGNSPTDAFPSIAGQSDKYLLKQLWDIRTKRREVAVMNGLLDNLSDQEMADLAAYYAVQTPQTGAADPELVALGEQVYRAGVPRKNVAACAACHGPRGEGNNWAVFPMLAGQWPAYTVSQLEMFRSGERNNDGESRMMRGIAMDLSDEEIEAVASYIYGLR